MGPLPPAACRPCCQRASLIVQCRPLQECGDETQHQFVTAPRPQKRPLSARTCGSSCDLSVADSQDSCCIDVELLCEEALAMGEDQGPAKVERSSPALPTSTALHIKASEACELMR